MSSSYLNLKRLEISYVVYVEPFRDHQNGILDLLWPIVVLMLKVKLQWLPGWKLPAFIAALQRINLFSAEIINETPCVTASPCLTMHAQDIKF